MSDIRPADLARAHALAAMAEHADKMAEASQQALKLAARIEDREYLRARAQAATSIALGLRNAPGYRV